MSFKEVNARRTPVIAEDSGWVTDAVHEGVSGRLIPEGSVTDIEQGVISLPTDQSYCARLAKGGYRRVTTHFTGDRIAGQVESLFPQERGSR